MEEKEQLIKKVQTTPTAKKKLDFPNKLEQMQADYNMGLLTYKEYLNAVARLATEELITYSN
jgi:hypothetical protein